MSEPTITNTLDEEMLASEPDVIFLHSLVSLPYAIYGIATYSVMQLEIMIQEVLTAIDQYVVAGSMANTRTTGDGDVSLRKIKTLSDLHPSGQQILAKRSEAALRINNRLGLIKEAYENLYVPKPITRDNWNRALYKLGAYYKAQYTEMYDRRYLVYKESLNTKIYVSPSASRNVTLVTEASTIPSAESTFGPFNLLGETLTVTADGIPVSVTLPDSTSAVHAYTGAFIATDTSAPSVITTGYTSGSKLIDLGTCDINNDRVTFTVGDPIGAGLATGDILRLDTGVSTDLYVKSVLNSTEVLVVTSAGFGPVYLNVPYVAYYRPELVVVLNGTAQTWELNLADTTSAHVASTLNAQSPDWTASAVGNQLKIEGPTAGAEYSIMVSGRSAIPYGFPLNGGPNWMGADANTYVNFEVGGSTVSRTLAVGTYTSSELAIAIAPLPGDFYTVSSVDEVLTVSSTAVGPTVELHWVLGLGQEESWSYGADVKANAVVDALVAAGLSAKLGIQPQPTVVITALESLQCSASTVGFPTTVVYGTRTEVSYTGSNVNDTWEESYRYVWDGEYVQPPMSFSDSSDISIYYGGTFSWGEMYEHLHDMHNSDIVVPDGNNKVSLDTIKFFLNTLLTGIGKYSKPVYSNVQVLLESLEEGQHTRLVQELVVFDVPKAISIALIGRKNLDYVAEILPSRQGVEGGTERGSLVADFTSKSEDPEADTYFDLEDDPMTIQFPDSRVRY